MDEHTKVVEERDRLQTVLDRQLEINSGQADRLTASAQKLKDLTEWAEYWSKPQKGYDSETDKGWRFAAQEVLQMIKRDTVSAGASAE